MARRIESPNLLLQTYIVDQLVGALLADAMADAELARGEFAVQSVIGAFGPIMPSELAQMLGIPPTTLSAHLRRFTDRDHLVRTPNPSDGRSYLVTLSAKGRAAVTKAHSALERTLQDVHRQLEPRSAEAIGEALAQFEQALQRGGRHRLAHRSHRQPGRIDDRDRRAARHHPLRAGRALGRVEQRPGDLSHRPGDGGG